MFIYMYIYKIRDHLFKMKIKFSDSIGTRYS